MWALTRTQRQTLLKLLRNLPSIEEPSVRRLLLSGLPQGLQDRVPYASTPAVDLAHIIDTVDSPELGLAARWLLGHRGRR